MAKKNKKQVGKNYLDFVPIQNQKYVSETDEKGNVTILVENKGLCNRMAQRFLKKPPISYIHLDEMGNFIWPFLDGTHTVYEIAGLVHETFGEKAEPLYDRLVQYMKNLENYGFIQVK
ncbi:MAG: PqqD family protein [Lachnospiraceae bacterium]